MMKKIIVVSAAVGLFVLLAWAQGEGQQPIGVDGQIPIGTFTCADHVEMTEAQDGRSDVRIVRAHGYYSALRGVDENSPPIDVREMVEFSQRLDKACRNVVTESRKSPVILGNDSAVLTGPRH